MTDKYITSSQYREGLNSIKEYIDKSIPHIGYPVIFTLSADKVLEIYNSTNHEMEFDKPSSIDLNKEIIMTYNNEDIISENSLDNYIRYKNNNIAISFHIGYDINKNTNENKMVITIVELNTNITSDLILKQREDKYLNNKYLKKDVAIQNSITIGTRIISSIGQYSFSNGKETTASGDYSHAEGENTQAVNANCHAEGFYSCASGESSHAEGYWSSASGSYSHAEGIETTASGKYSHAEGNSTKASGESSHAEGNRTDASGVYSHAEGMNTEALGAGSHAEGWATTASSYYSHAEGYFTKASSKAQHVQGKYNIEDTKNKYAHIVGNGTDDTVRSNAHTLDWNGNAWFAGDVQANNIPHVISEKVVLTVPAATITEKKTEIINAAGNIVQIPVDGAVTYDPTKSYYAKYNNTQYHVIYVDGGFRIIGDDCKCAIMSISANNVILAVISLDVTNITDMQLIEKDIKKLDNMYIPNDLDVNNSITVGARNGTIGHFSSSFGLNCEASGDNSHAEGFATTASGKSSHAEGDGTIASGKNSHAEGENTTASGYGSHTEGFATTASADHSHAEGYNTTASGSGSHTEGTYTTASGRDSHAEGIYTKASSEYQHVQGRYNIEDTENKYAHIVGNGMNDATTNWKEVRSNAHTLDWAGNAWYAGDVQANNVPYVASEKVVLTVPAATITEKKTEIDKATQENPAQINVTGTVTYDSTKLYYLKYNNKEYFAAYSTDKFTSYGDDCLCGIGTQKGNTILMIASLDTTNITDLQLIEKDIKKLGNMYIPNDLNVNNSITVGIRTGKIGNFSSSFGFMSESSGNYSHVEGLYNNASSECSHAEGYGTTASGYRSHAEGNNTTASGSTSHAEGSSSSSSAYCSHAEGSYTTASGAQSHAEGSHTTASGTNSHTEGYETIASGQHQHVQGKHNIEDTEDKYAHIVGNGTDNNKSNAHTLDWKGNAWFAGDVQSNNVPYTVSEKVVLTVPAATITEKKTEIDKATQENPAQINITGNVAYDSTKSYYLKYNNKEYPSVYSTGMFYIAEDDCFCIIEFRNGSIVMEVVTLDTTNITDLQLIEKNIKKLDNKYVPNDLNVNNSITVGIRTGKIGEFSSSFGISCEASGDLSHAEGMFTTASGNYSHAEGETTTASGRSSHAECYNTTASGDYSHAEGMYTTALSDASHAEGSSTTASGFASHAEGDNTTASGDNSHVQGKYNIEDTENKYAHIVGNGSEDIRSNAHTLDWEGNAWFAGNVSIDGTPTNDKDLVNKKYVDDKISNIPDAYTLLYPKEVDRTIAYYDIYDLPLGDYRIAQQDGIRTWHICVYVNNIRTQLFSTQNSRGFSFSKRINGTGTADGKSGKLITIDTYSMTTGGETYTWMVYDDGSVDVKNHKATILSAYTNTEFTPTKDYQPATKKYVDDAKASIVVPTKTSELTNDSGFLTSIPEEYVTETKLTSKGYLTEHQSLDGYAKTEYVDSKTTLEETIFEGVASDTLNDYWTHCSLVDGEGCWVIDKEVIIGENIENPYYIEINGTDIYSPENSTYDATNKAWLYDYTMDNGKKLFICANYENQNKMVVPWDGMGSYDKLKIFTRTELGKKIEEQQQHSINKLATKEKPVFIGNISMGRKKGSTIGGYSVAIGYDITASGYASHAEGDNTVASGNQSHAEGERTTASGYNSHAEGYKTIASNTLSHAEGNSTTASGYASHAEGDNTVASGDHSHAEGNNTISSSENQHVQGKYNIEDKDNKYAHIVGNGSNNSTRSNAHTLDWNGNAWYAGKLSQEGNPTEDKDLATKKYVDDAKASIVVPTKTSELTNDSNFLTEHQSLTKYATIDYVDSKLTTNYVSKEELTESTKPADTTTVKTTLNNILGGDYIE